MSEQKMKITDKTFSDFTGTMCRADFTNSVSNQPLNERQQNQLTSCVSAEPYTEKSAPKAEPEPVAEKEAEEST